MRDKSAPTADRSNVLICIIGPYGWPDYFVNMHKWDGGRPSRPCKDTPYLSCSAFTHPPSPLREGYFPRKDGELHPWDEGGASSTPTRFIEWFANPYQLLYNSKSFTVKTGGKPHWQDRHRYVCAGRMAWYGEAGDEHYWYEYWRARLTPGYYADAEAADLTGDELGKVLLKAMRPGGLHLEAGCGAGYWVAALRRYGLMIEGIEYAQNLVNLVASVNPGLPMRQGNALHIERPDNYYDSYLSIGVVEHRIEGPEPFLAEAYRVLKPGGKILIAVPYFGAMRVMKSQLGLYDREPPSLPFFQYGFSREEFTALLQKAGFSIEEVQALYAHRLLLEEMAFYRWALNKSWGRFARKWAEVMLRHRDGHMLLVAGEKPVAVSGPGLNDLGG